MVERVRSIERKLLPKGLLDAVVQLGLFASCYLAYQVVRSTMGGTGAEATAFWNATQLIQLEQALNIFVEPTVQAWSRSSGTVIGFADWMYINSHYVITFGALVFIYFRRNPSFYFVRNMFVAAMLIALVGYALYPTAPPRLMPEWGFSDTIALTTGVKVDNEKASALVNLYAAVPSMHVCFALMVGGTMSLLVSRSWARWLWRFYPLLVTWVVVATGNHFLLDAVLGAMTALAAWAIARRLASVRGAWAFRPQAEAAQATQRQPALATEVAT
ncbi:MAG: phosphatase PAP2 family protein [Actinomycetes bacterium]